MLSSSHRPGEEGRKTKKKKSFLNFSAARYMPARCMRRYASHSELAHSRRPTQTKTEVFGSFQSFSLCFALCNPLLDDKFTSLCWVFSMKRVFSINDSHLGLRLEALTTFPKFFNQLFAQSQKSRCLRASLWSYSPGLSCSRALLWSFAGLESQYDPDSQLEAFPFVMSPSLEWITAQKEGEKERKFTFLGHEKS